MLSLEEAKRILKTAKPDLIIKWAWLLDNKKYMFDDEEHSAMHAYSVDALTGEIGDLWFHDWADFIDEGKVVKFNEYGEEVASEEDIRSRMEQFDEKFLEYISDHTEGNFMVSPLSLRYALAMLLAGAEGGSREELLGVLQVKTETEVREYFRPFHQFVAERNRYALEQMKEIEEGIKEGWLDPSDVSPQGRFICIANSIWKNPGAAFEYRKGYMDDLEKDLSAECRCLPDTHAGKAVNDWISDKTDGMIDRIMTDDYQGGDTGLLLINSLYFASKWAVPFDKEITEEGTFTTKNGDVVKKMFMNQIDWFPYYSDDRTQLISMQLRGGVSVAFVLGDTAEIGRKLEKAGERKVNVTVPRIEMETAFDKGQLMDYLKANGAVQIFDRKQKNFPKIADYPLYVADIAQKTKLQLNEEGVKAAAATVNNLVAGACDFFNCDEPVIFRADRPFSFYIYTEIDGEKYQLFSGKINE